MRSGRIGLFALLAATLAAGCGDEDPTEPGEETPTAAVVSMPGTTFTPFTTNIAVGGTVTFDFPALPHNVIFRRILGAPQDIQQIANARVSRTFQVAGSFDYDCTLHPGMSGVVVAR